MTHKQRLLLRNLEHYAEATTPDRLLATQEVIKLVQAEPNFNSREIPIHLTASAVVLSPDLTSMAMIHHRKLGRWLQPGGHIEHEIHPLDSARREAQEEAGLGELLLLSEQIFDVDGHDVGIKTCLRHLDIRFLFLAESDAMTANTQETLGARWISFEEAERISDEPTARLARKAQQFVNAYSSI